MEYFTNQNDLNKLDSVSPNNPDGSEKNNTKINVLDVFVTSTLKINKLVETCVTGANRFVAYAIFIAIFSAMISFAVPSASRITSFKGFSNLFSNVLPNIEVKDGALYADKKFEMKLSTTTILINTDKNEFTRDDFEKSGVYIAFGKRKFKMVSFAGTKENSMYNELYSFDIGTYLWDGFTNQDLMKMIPAFYILLVVSVLGVAAFNALKYLFVAGIFTVLFRTATTLIKIPMTLKDTFHLCFYAQTISIILTSMNRAVDYILFPTLLSIIGLFVTGIVIKKALQPHMPDIEDLIDRFNRDR
ncbi:MAG: DUF1189 family protein [Eubacterium sp.]|nr:DUF1189 family protein [Eubacterium sp.]